MKIRDYTSKLSFDELLEIIDNITELNTKAAIGDCLLRNLVKKIVTDIGIQHPPIVLWMDKVANDCYQLIAEKSIENGFRF